MRFLRFFIYGVPALLLCVLIAAFFNSFFLSSKKKNEISISLPVEPPTLNPIQLSEATSGQVAGFLFNGLIKLNQDLEIVGDLATDWSQSQITTFRFQNSEVASQARDFLASQQASHPERSITSLELNNEKLLVTLTQPGYDVSEKIATEFKASYNQHPIGTGPFLFSEWKKNEYIRLVRNPDYFLGSPWLDAIVFRILTDPLTLRLAFETHQIDFWAVNSCAVKSFSRDPRFDLFSEQGNSYYYIGWNLKRPLFADLRVREAMAHAVNIPEMIRYAFYGHGVASTGNFTPRMWFYNPAIKPLAYDPEQAKALLDEAGWKPGSDGIRCRDGKRFSFTLLISNGGGAGSDIATLMQADLKKIGVEAKLEIYEWAVFLKHISEHDFDATVSAWALSNDFDQHALWDSSQSHPGEMNYVGYNNPRVDELLTKLQQEYSRPEIIKLANEMQATIYHDQPYLFLFVPQLTSVMWKDSYRVCYPTDHGWIDAPVQMTKAGWQYNMEWFYKPGSLRDR